MHDRLEARHRSRRRHAGLQSGQDLHRLGRGHQAAACGLGPQAIEQGAKGFEDRLVDSHVNDGPLKHEDALLVESRDDVALEAQPTR